MGPNSLNASWPGRREPYARAERHSAGLLADHREVLPNHEPTQGVPSLRLGQCQLVLDTVELIFPSATRFGQGASTAPR
jgi:hypothetical protein